MAVYAARGRGEIAKSASHGATKAKIAMVVDSLYRVFASAAPGRHRCIHMEYTTIPGKPRMLPQSCSLINHRLHQPDRRSTPWFDA
jgi:hypothetical protein